MLCVIIYVTEAKRKTKGADIRKRRRIPDTEDKLAGTHGDEERGRGGAGSWRDKLRGAKYRSCRACAQQGNVPILL